ncbi:hypothetical protein MP638_002782 [Amoeboaphelidium occidentale]|nr:hypothetical protein MP638_002782 [Amoeboaphelidium occidentale]
MSLWSFNGPCGYSSDDADGLIELKQHSNETRLKLLKTPPNGETKLKVLNVSVSVLLVMKQQLIDATDYYYQLDGSYLVLKDVPYSSTTTSQQQLLQVKMFLVNMTRPLYKCYKLESGGTGVTDTAKTKDLAYNPITGIESNLITASEYPVDLNNRLFVSTPIGNNDHQYQLVLRTNLEMINVVKWYIELELSEEVEEVEVIGATSFRVEKKDNSTSVLVLLEFDHSERNLVLWFQDGFGFVLIIKGNQSPVAVIKRAIVDYDKQVDQTDSLVDYHDYHDFIVRVVTLNDFTSEFIHVKIIIVVAAIVNLDLRKETTILLKQLSFIVDDYAFYECMNNCSGHHQFQNNIVLSPLLEENNYEFDLWLRRKSSGFYDVFLPTDFIVVYSDHEDKEQLSKVVKVYHELASV